MDLKSYAQKHLFSPMDVEVGDWLQDGDHRFNFAWGHGGQLIVLLDELDMVIVTTADPFFGQHDGGSWKHEKAIMNLVGDFIKSLPNQ